MTLRPVGLPNSRAGNQQQLVQRMVEVLNGMQGVRGVAERVIRVSDLLAVGLVQFDRNGNLVLVQQEAGVAVPDDTSSIVASETLSAGNLVSVWNDAGTPKVRKADATAVGKEFVGFVLADVSPGALATVYHSGKLVGLSGLTPGDRYFVSKTAGGVTNDISSYTTGNIRQFVGIAVSATVISTQPGEPYTIGT